jgi:hypothetical protein
MREIRTIPIDEPFEDIEEDLSHIEMHLAGCPLTEKLAPPFTELQVELEKLRAEEKSLKDAVARADAQALFLDDTLNEIAAKAKTAVLAAYPKEEYQAPLYLQLFEGQSPSEFARPVMGDQYTSMRDKWIGPLQGTEIPSLVAIAELLPPVILKGDAILSAQALAKQKEDAFKLGPRADFVGRVNAARKLAQGKVAEFFHDPSQKLPSDFQERFFLYNVSAKAPKISDVEQSIERTKAKLARQEALLASLKEKRDKVLKAREDAKETERKNKLAAAEKKKQEWEAEIEKLKAEAPPDE